MYELTFVDQITSWINGILDNALRRRYGNQLPAIAFGPLKNTGEKMHDALNESN